MPSIALTASFIRGLKPPKAGRVEYWDNTTKGLCLRLTAAGRGSWSYRYRPREGGKHERVTFGDWRELSLADARDRATRVRAAVIDGSNPQQTRRQKREASKRILTFDALADRYLAEAQRNKASWKHDEQRLVRPRAAFGGKEAAAITRRDLITFLDEVKTTVPVQANRIQSVISCMFNWAVEEELLDVNPISGLKKRGGKETASTRTLSTAELRVLWRALEDTRDTSPDIAAALRLLLLVGQRPNEGAGAQQDELKEIDDPKTARWEIPSQRMKARRPHVIPLAPMARELFRAMLERRRQDGSTAGIFASRFTGRTTLARHSLSQALRRVIARLPTDGSDADAVRSLQRDPPVPHDFRRTVATQLAALGVPREDRLAILAHKASDVHGAVYDQYERLREKRAALARWERHITEIVSGKTTDDAVVVTLDSRRG